MTPRQRTENLYQHVKRLCQILEANGIKQRNRYLEDGEYLYNESNWTVNEDDPATTFLGSLCHRDNREAFLYLKKLGALDNGVCWKCGESPITKEYEFSSGNDIRYSICKNCYQGGLSFQKQVFDFINSVTEKNDQTIQPLVDTKSHTSEERTERRSIRRMSNLDKLKARKSINDLDTYSVTFTAGCDLERLHKIGFKGSEDCREITHIYSLVLEKIAESALKIEEKKGIKQRVYEIKEFFDLYKECFNHELDKFKLDLPLFVFTNLYLHSACRRLFKQADVTIKRKYFENIYIACTEAYPMQSQFNKKETIELMDKLSSFLQVKFP